MARRPDDDKRRAEEEAAWAARRAAYNAEEAAAGREPMADPAPGPEPVTEAAAPTQEEETAWAARTAALNATNAAAAVAQQSAPAPDPQAAPVDLPGAQVVLDPAGDAAKAARGELFHTIQENTVAYQLSPETP